MADLWWVFWFCLGVNIAYLFAFAFLTVCLAMGKRGHDELATALAVATAVGTSWLLGYAVAGPLWAPLTVPALLAALYACVRLCAYIREQRARVRVERREAGR